MRLHFLLSAIYILCLPSDSISQVSHFFDDKAGWQTDAGTISVMEDFESFTADSTSFQGVKVFANGFSLIDVNNSNVVYGDNFIDGSAPFHANSNGTRSAMMFLNFQGPIQVCMEFNPPVRSFHADFYSVDGAEKVMVDLYSGNTLIADTALTMPDDLEYGFVLDPAELDVTKILFRAHTSNITPNVGEGFFLDNVMLVQSFLIPTLSEWAIILLCLFLLIVGNLAYQQRRVRGYS